MTLRSHRATQLDRRRHAHAQRRRRHERRPDPTTRPLTSFARLEALSLPSGDPPAADLPSVADSPPSPVRADASPTPVQAEASSDLTPAARVVELAPRSRVGRVMVLSTVGSLAAGLLAVETAAATPLPASPPPVLAQAPLVATAITGLEQGSRGENVRQLQQALIGAGIPVGGGADGIFGPKTRASVERFQAANGLTVTGRVDQATADALAASQGGAGQSDSGGSGGTGGDSPPSGSGIDPYVGLSRGAEGALVEELQRALVDKGVWLASISGVFDASTERGVRQFQTWNQLGVTGTVTIAAARRLGLGGGSTPNTAPTPAPADTPSPTDTASPADAPADGGQSTPSAYIGLTKGARGPLVADLQRSLIDRGITVVGGADGMFGPKTQAALVEFQRANGLSPTGVVAAADVNALGLAGDEPVSPPASAGFIGLARGARGAEVRELQQSLLDAGVRVPGGADGIFGPKTEAALQSYQTAQGLMASGVVDESTVQRLGLGTADGPQPFTPQAPTDEAGAEATPASGNPYVGLRRGDSGPLVLEVQEGLEEFGFVIIGGADGNFGPSTEKTLKAFQSVNDIPQTGVVTARGAQILGLGSGSTGSGGDGSGGGSGPSFQMERFPVQGLCFFGDTWHAPRGGGRLHVGTDIIADEGKLLYAVVDGTISKLYWDQPGALAGNGLRVLQDDGTWFTYLHMLDFAPGIELGTKVKAGDVIGWVGNTGSSATPHLHFEIHPGGGEAINPYPYLKAINDCGNETPQYQSSFNPEG